MKISGPVYAALAVVACLVAMPGAARGQASPLVLEVRNGVTAPVSAFGEAEPGRSFGLALVLSGAGRRATYWGFSQHRFGCEPLGCPAGGDYTATGFNAGFRIDLRTRGTVIPWLQLGGVTTQVELPVGMVDADDLSSLGFGGEIGAGLYIGASNLVALVPGVRLTGVNTELPGGETLRMRYLVAEIAVALAF